MAPFAVALDFLVEEYAAGKGSLPPRKRRKKSSVFIATIEKSLAMLDSLIEVDRANEIGLIVVDELHIIGDGSRGATLETLLTKAMFIQAGIQIVGMSATIGNLSEIAQFLNADVYCRDFRPVELTEYIKCGADILEVVPNAKTVEEAFVVSRSVEYSVSYLYQTFNLYLYLQIIFSTKPILRKWIQTILPDWCQKLFQMRLV